MKVFLLLTSVIFFSLIGIAQSPKDEQLVSDVVRSFVADYNNGDFKNASLYTTADWVHINPGGGITRGREDILKEVRASIKPCYEG